MISIHLSISISINILVYLSIFKTYIYIYINIYISVKLLLTISYVHFFVFYVLNLLKGLVYGHIAYDGPVTNNRTSWDKKAINLISIILCHRHIQSLQDTYIHKYMNIKIMQCISKTKIIHTEK